MLRKQPNLDGKGVALRHTPAERRSRPLRGTSLHRRSYRCLGGQEHDPLPPGGGHRRLRHPCRADRRRARTENERAAARDETHTHRSRSPGLLGHVGDDEKTAPTVGAPLSRTSCHPGKRRRTVLASPPSSGSSSPPRLVRARHGLPRERGLARLRAPLREHRVYGDTEESAALNRYLAAAPPTFSSVVSRRRTTSNAPARCSAEHRGGAWPVASRPKIIS